MSLQFNQSLSGQMINLLYSLVRAEQKKKTDRIDNNLLLTQQTIKYFIQFSLHILTAFSSILCSIVRYRYVSS